MLFKGTRLRSSSQIIERMESVGAELNAYTTKEETMLYATRPLTLCSALAAHDPRYRSP